MSSRRESDAATLVQSHFRRQASARRTSEPQRIVPQPRKHSSIRRKDSDTGYGIARPVLHKTTESGTVIHPGLYALRELRDLLDEHKARDLDLFNTYWDANSDGSVSKKEFKRAWHSMGGTASDESVDALFELIDKECAVFDATPHATNPVGTPPTALTDRSHRRGSNPAADSCSGCITYSTPVGRANHARLLAR